MDRNLSFKISIGKKEGIDIVYVTEISDALLTLLSG
jgi:hypothetical protein